MSGLAEILDWVEPAAGGWRYIFSSAFRARTHDSWRDEHIGYVISDVFWGVLGIVVSLGVVSILAVLVWEATTL